MIVLYYTFSVLIVIFIAEIRELFLCIIRSGSESQKRVVSKNIEKGITIDLLFCCNSAESAEETHFYPLEYIVELMTVMNVLLKVKRLYVIIY